jgi:hypothetical protein
VTIAGHRVLKVNFELRYTTTLRVFERRARIVEAVAQQGDVFEFTGDGAALVRNGGARTTTLDSNRVWYQAEARPEDEIEEATLRAEVLGITQALADNVGKVGAGRAGARLLVQLRTPPPEDLQAEALKAAATTRFFAGGLGVRPGERLRRVEIAYDAGREQRALRWHLGDEGLVCDIDCGLAQPEPPYAAVLDTALAFADAVVSSLGLPDEASPEGAKS